MIPLILQSGRIQRTEVCSLVDMHLKADHRGPIRATLPPEQPYPVENFINLWDVKFALENVLFCECALSCIGIQTLDQDDYTVKF